MIEQWTCVYCGDWNNIEIEAGCLHGEQELKCTSCESKSTVRWNIEAYTSVTGLGESEYFKQMENEGEK